MSCSLFNAFTDPAPDRWGQTLLRRYERARARREKRQPRTLFAIDFLVLVDDETRLGGLRFQDAAGGPFLSASAKRVPSFGIAKPTEARAIVREVGRAVATWRSVAAKNGIAGNEIERMESAFEHEDLRRATSGAA